MRTLVKRVAGGTAIGGALLMTGGLGVAAAQPPVVINDGLVNVTLGDITILEDVNVGVAAAVVAQICDVNVTAAVLGTVDQTGQTSESFCTIEPVGPVTVTQNAPGSSENAPGQNR